MFSNYFKIITHCNTSNLRTLLWRTCPGHIRIKELVASHWKLKMFRVCIQLSGLSQHTNWTWMASSAYCFTLWSCCIAWPACYVCGACVHVCVLTWMEPLYCMASMLCVVVYAHPHRVLVMHGQRAVCGACVHVCMLTWMEPLYCLVSMLCGACVYVRVLTWMEPLYCMASMIRFCSRVRFCSGAFFSSDRFMSFWKKNIIKLKIALKL